MNFSYDVHVLLAKSEKLVGRRRWLSSYDKSILRNVRQICLYALYINQSRSNFQRFKFVLSPARITINLFNY